MVAALCVWILLLSMSSLGSADVETTILIEHCKQGWLKQLNEQRENNLTGSYHGEERSAEDVLAEHLAAERICIRIMTEIKENSSTSEDVVVQRLKFGFSGVGIIVVCVLGCIGNGLSLVILKGKMYTSSTNFYLVALAVTDSFLLMSAFSISLNDILLTRWPGSINTFNFQAYARVYGTPLVNTFQTISIWLVLAFTVDRYIMICHPYQGAKFCNRKRAVIVVACLYVCGFLCNIPNFLERRVEAQTISGDKYLTAVLTEFGGSRFYLVFVQLWAYLIFVVVIPCLTLGILNFLLIVAVKKSRTRGRRLSLGTTCNHRNDTTLMLAAVVVVFLVCQLPALISHTIWGSNPDSMINWDSHNNYPKIIVDIANFLVILNSAINLALYYAFSPRFRAAFGAKFGQPVVEASKVLFTNFSGRLPCHSAAATDSTGLSDDETVLHSPKNHGHHCHGDSSTSSTIKFAAADGFATQNTTFTCNTLLTADGTNIITSDAAVKLSHSSAHADSDNVSQSSNDSANASDPIYV